MPQRLLPFAKSPWYFGNALKLFLRDCDCVYFPCRNLRSKGKCGVISALLRLLSTMAFALFVSITYMHSTHAASMSDMEKPPTRSNTNINEGNEWIYFKGTQKPPFKWNYPGFREGDKKWIKGRTGVGYSMDNLRSILDDMRGNYSTVYARREFSVNDPSRVKKITVSLVCDGPFIIYVNGIEAIRSHDKRVANRLPNNTPQAIQLDISGFIDELLIGANILSIQCSNTDVNDKSFTFIPEMVVLH